MGAPARVIVACAVLLGRPRLADQMGRALAYSVVVCSPCWRSNASMIAARMRFMDAVFVTEAPEIVGS